MAGLLHQYLDLLTLFLLVLSRLSGLFMLAPVLGSVSVPARVRAILAICFAMIVTPILENPSPPAHLLELAKLVTGELLVGVALGLGVRIIFSGIQLTGQIIGQMSGMSLADVFDPTTQANVPVFGQLLDIFTIAIFLLIGGHRTLIAALLDTFAWLPAGHGTFAEGLLDALLGLTHHSFSLGIRGAAPMMVSLMLAVLVMGLISRTMPQLNIIAVGFSMNSLVMMATLWISIGSVGMLFQEDLENHLAEMTSAIGQAAAEARAFDPLE